MRYFYLASEGELNGIFHHGVEAKEKSEITIIALRDDFLMDKFVFDVFAHDILGLDVYCLFQISSSGICGEIIDSEINHIFSDSFKILKQDSISRQHMEPYKSSVDYTGMGLMAGDFPVENKDKFTPGYKKKVLEYLKALDG